MSYIKHFLKSRNIFKNYYNIFYQIYFNGVKKIELVKPKIFHDNTKIILTMSILSWNPFKNSNSDDNSPEDQLIMTIKRSILLIQKGDTKKAEQMLHLALRMAQDLNSKDGITYIYDVMANLAMEVQDYVKAEKLFTDVMRRLLADGIDQNDNKILHISLKIAHMAHMQNQIEKAIQGFQWTLDEIEKKLKTVNDDDLLEMWSLAQNYYAQLLMDLKKFVEAEKYLTESYKIYTNIHGIVNREAIMMMNNLSVICLDLNEYTKAREYLEKAIETAKDIPDMLEVGVLQANLGLLYLRQGLVSQAKEICALAWRMGKKNSDDDTLKQADYCLEEIKKFSSST